MGYFADAYGSVTLKSSLDPNIDSMDLVGSILENYEFETEYDEKNNKVFINYDGKYTEDSIDNCLEEISSYIQEGYISFTGEDNSVWRFIFNPETETWLYQEAVIDFDFESYSDEQLINELKKRGYVDFQTKNIIPKTEEIEFEF